MALQLGNSRNARLLFLIVQGTFYPLLVRTTGLRRRAWSSAVNWFVLILISRISHGRASRDDARCAFNWFQAFSPIHIHLVVCAVIEITLNKNHHRCSPPSFSPPPFGSCQAGRTDCSITLAPPHVHATFACMHIRIIRIIRCASWPLPLPPPPPLAWEPSANGQLIAYC